MSFSTIPYWRLRRLSPRVLAILDRHVELEPVIAAYANTIGLTAATFRDIYDRSLAKQDTQGVRNATGRAKVDKLRQKLRGWVAMVGAEVDFDATKYGDNPNVPDDVINDVEQFLTFVTEYEESAGEPLGYSDALRTDLEQALADAKALMAEVSTGAAGRSSMTEELRTAAQAFHRDLVAFRRTLAAHLGTSHADYQKLRTVRAQTPDADDDQVADDMPPEDEVSPEEALEDAIAESGEIDGAEEAAE